MSFPYMPFYVADYLSKTAHLTCAEHGAYLLLLMHCWEHHQIPLDDAKLARIARVNGRTWHTLKPAVMDYFKDGQHPRINQELEKADEKRKRRMEAGKAGGLAKAAASNAIAMLQQCSSNAVASSSEPYPVHKESKKDSTAEDADFERLWSVYPKRGGSPARKEGRRAFRGARGKGIDASSIIEGASHYAEGIRADGKEGTPFVAQLATWLNQERWKDVYTPEKRLGRNGKQNLADTAAELQRKWFGRTDEAHNGTGSISGQAPVILLPIRGGAGPGDVRNGHSFDAEPVRGPSDPASDGPAEGDAGDLQLPALGGGRSS